MALQLTAQHSLTDDIQWTTVPTDWQKIGIACRGDAVLALTWGQSETQIQQRLEAGTGSRMEHNPSLAKGLKKALARYFQGRPVQFGAIIDISWASEFAQAILRACAEISYGRQITYGQLAELAGSPKAARAAGHVMAQNLVPIIIPCHRVVPASGALGGYSGPGNVKTKQFLLNLENQIADDSY